MSGPRNTQSWIVDPAIRLGFQSNIDGICYAKAHVAKYLIRKGRINELKNYIKIIEELGSQPLTTDNSIPDDKRYVLNQIINDLKGKRFKIGFASRDIEKDQIEIKDTHTGATQSISIIPPLKHINNNKELKILFHEILAFYNEMEVYFHPYKYPEFFEKGKKPHTQDYRFTERILRSEKEADEYSIVSHKTGRFDQNVDQDGNRNPIDLLDYVHKFVDIIHASKGQFQIDAILRSGNHAITLGFHPNTRELIIANANPPPLLSLPLNHDFKLEQSDEIKAAQFLENSFFLNQQPNTPIFFGSLISVPKAAEKALEPHFKKWNEEFENAQINRKKMKYISSDDKDPTGVSGLYVAARNNDTLMMKTLLQYLADPNVTYSGFTPLYAAAERGYLEAVKCLLDFSKQKQIDIEKGLVINNITHYSPFYAAARNGKFDVVKLLADHGVKIDVPSIGDSKTPIYGATENGYTAIVEFLLDKGAAINQLHNGKSLLIAAAEAGHDDIVKLLLKRGADFYHLYQGENALHIAAKNGHVKVVEEILKYSKAPIDKLDQQHMLSPLQMAIINGHHDVAEVLLNNQAKMVDQRLGEAYLKQASTECNTKMVELLLKHGIQFELNHKTPKDALEDAIRQENIADLFTVLTVLDHRKVNDPIDDKNNTLLGLAVKEQKIKSIKFLCAHTNANRNVHYNDKPLLWYAVESNNKPLIKCLLQNRITIGETLHLYYNKGDLTKVALLCAEGANIDAPYPNESLLRKAAIRDDQNAINFLISQKANYLKLYKEAMKENNTAIITALLKNQTVKTALENKISLIEFALENKLANHALDLIKIQLNVNKLSSDGRSLLYKAVVARNDVAIKLLLEKGISTDKDLANVIMAKTLINLVGDNDQQGIDLLLKHKVDINIQHDFKTALYYAAKLKNNDLINMLIKNGASVEMALIRAAKDGDKDIVEQLLPFHGSVDKPLDTNNLTLLVLAASRNKLNLIDFLISKGAKLKGIQFDGKPLLYYMCEVATNVYDDDTRKKILSYINSIIKADPESVGQTLCLFVKVGGHNGYQGLTLLLEDAKVSPDVVDKSTQETALYVAAYADKIKFVECLLEHNADNRIPCHGNLPSEVAKESISIISSSPSTKEMLVKHEDKREYLDKIQSHINEFYTEKEEGMSKLKELVSRLSHDLIKDYKIGQNNIDYKHLAIDLMSEQGKFSKPENKIYFTMSRLPTLCKQYYYIEKFNRIMSSDQTAVEKYQQIRSVFENSVDSEKKINEILDFNPKRVIVKVAHKMTKFFTGSSSSSSSASQTNAYSNSSQSSTMFQPASSSSSTTNTSNPDNKTSSESPEKNKLKKD